MRRFFYIPALLFLLICGCSERKTSETSVSQVKTGEKNIAGKTDIGVTQEAAQSEKRDFAAICKSGELRVLTTENDLTFGLPRTVSLQQRELIMLHRFAAGHKLKLKIINLPFCELAGALLDGRGDVISANFSVTPQRRQKMDFSLPLSYVHEHLVGRKTVKLRTFGDLSGKRITIEKGSCYWENARLLKRKIPGIELESSDLDTEALLYAVAAGKKLMTIADGNYLHSFTADGMDLKSVHRFKEKRPIAWAIRKGSNDLRRELDSFIRKNSIKINNEIFTGDLAAIKKRGVLRVLIRNNPHGYFIHRGMLMGFEYELARKFAQSLGVELAVIVPPRWEDLFTYLKAGKGDIIASTLTVTEQRKSFGTIEFCRPYGDIKELIVARKDDPIISEQQLNSRAVAVRRSSSYYETLKAMRKRGIKPYIVAVPEDVEDHEIAERVAAGRYQLTLIDDAVFYADCSHLDDLKVAFELEAPRHYAWMVRKNNPELKAAVNEFFTRHHKSAFFNITFRKYFRRSRPELKESVRDNARKFRISKYDPVIKDAASRYSLPWCLTAAQIYQESRFDASCRAWDGGMGLMQLMPATAKELRCTDPFDPVQNVDAGSRYMYQLRQRAGTELAAEDQLAFALAAYNGGFGHLIDARHLAMIKGYDPDRWRGNVENAYKLLGTREYGRKARYGRCHSRIIINYVNQILLRYHHYFQAQKTAAK